MTLSAVVERLHAFDDRAAVTLNGLAHTRARARWIVSAGAAGLASVEVLLMGVLALGGRRRSALNMLAAVGLVYVASEMLGVLWPRQRPFERLSEVEALIAHEPGRSFPSRHVASGLAMAIIGRGAHPRLGVAMAGIAWALGLSRLAAGLHYPSDLLGGALLGFAISRTLDRWIDR